MVPAVNDSVGGEEEQREKEVLQLHWIPPSQGRRMKGQNRPTLVAKEPYYPGEIGEDLGVVGGYKYRIVCVRDRDRFTL